MGLLEEILKNREELLIKLLEILEGRESRAKVDLHGVEFHVGKSLVRMDGTVDLTFVPLEKKAKK
ncbi:MAG: hypothetical protein HY369_04795 [Candidatus Aenigmarchaeota archaeon]|nr:hypothetical protein [Candidatus Aenigmarchaeota archaeon]